MKAKKTLQHGMQRDMWLFVDKIWIYVLEIQRINRKEVVDLNEEREGDSLKILLHILQISMSLMLIIRVGEIFKR